MTSSPSGLFGCKYPSASLPDPYCPAQDTPLQGSPLLPRHSCKRVELLLHPGRCYKAQNSRLFARRLNFPLQGYWTLARNRTSEKRELRKVFAVAKLKLDRVPILFFCAAWTWCVSADASIFEPIRLHNVVDGLN